MFLKNKYKVEFWFNHKKERKELERKWLFNDQIKSIMLQPHQYIVELEVWGGFGWAEFICD